MDRCQIAFPPRLFSSTRAAAYLGISETTLRSLGLPRRILGARRLYDRYDLEAFADGLEIDGGEAGQLEKDQAECDRLFGVSE